MKIDKKELLKAFQGDFKESERLQRDWFIKREEWLSETYGRPYGNEVKNKSKLVSKDIKKQVDWMLPNLADPFLSSSEVISCSPITFEDAQAAKQNELLLNTQFCRKFNRFNFIMKALRVLATEGTVVIQTGWDYEDEEVEVESEVVMIDPMTGQEFVTVQQTTQLNVLKNQPTAIVCRNEDIFIDPTCMDDMDKCQFIVHRYQSSISALKADGRYKNLDKLMGEEHSLMEDPNYYREDLTYFEFKDKARKKLIVHEYWGNYDIEGEGELTPIVCAWVGNTIIRLETNPYPDKKAPFIVVPFNAVPFQLFGEALAENISDNQKIKTAITRGLIDNMAQSNNGQKGVRKGALDNLNRQKFFGGDNFEFNGTPNDFWDGSYNQIPSSVFDMLAVQNNEIESQTGQKSFSGGITGNALGGTATGARGALDATATRRLNLVRNISENMMKPLMRKWMSYNSEFLEEEEVVRITNDQFAPVRKDDLDGRIDIDISISTAEDNASKAQELSFLLQTVGPSEDPAVRREIMAQIMELMKMPDQAKKIRGYQPPPDQFQQQMQQLQMQLLEAQVANERAKAQENEIDARVKSAGAMLKEAQAQKTLSEKDSLDLDFLRKESRVDVSDKMKELEMQYKFQADSQYEKLQLELAKLQHKYDSDMSKQDYKHNSELIKQEHKRETDLMKQEQKHSSDVIKQDNATYNKIQETLASV